MIRAFATSTLGYYNVLFMELTLQSIQKLALVQNNSHCLICGVFAISTLDMLQDLHWLTIFCWVEYKVVANTYSHKWPEIYLLERMPLTLCHSHTVPD